MSQIAATDMFETSAFFSFRFAENPTQRLSAEKNGQHAPSPSGTGVTAAVSRTRKKSRGLPALPLRVLDAL